MCHRNSDNIVRGDNFYEQAHDDLQWLIPSFDLNKVYGHRVTQAGDKTILNTDMTSTILSISNGGHLNMPGLLFIQNIIARQAASAYRGET